MAASTKRLQINKANATMVLVVAISSFLVTFSLVAARALWVKQRYQSKVISKKEQARDQLEANIAATEQLATAYKVFTDQPTNIIGGASSGQADNSGDNAKIILDALPSKYDFPALTTSLEKLLAKGGFGLKSISGTDDELNQTDSATNSPQPVEMPFSFTSEGNFTQMKQLAELLERSVRPIQVQKVTLNGTDGKLTVTVDAKTFYQPGKSLTIKKETVK